MKFKEEMSFISTVASFNSAGINKPAMLLCKNSVMVLKNNFFSKVFDLNQISQLEIMTDPNKNSSLKLPDGSCFEFTNLDKDVFIDNIV